MSRIVVGVDGSESSKSALRWAARLLAITGEGIDAVTAWRIPSGYGWPYTAVDWDPEVDARKALEQSVEDVFGADRPEGLRLLVRHGNAAQVLLEASKDADVLVVGSRGHGGFAGLLLGSVSRHCVENSPVPVLVIRDSDSDSDSDSGSGSDADADGNPRQASDTP